MKKYPRIGSIRKMNPQHLCKICGKPRSDLRVEIQVSYMRGDDEVFFIHNECRKGLSEPEIIERILHG